MKTLRKEEGQTLVFTALAMAMLLGFMALAIDVGLLFRTRRHLQAVADDAALSGAMEFLYNGYKESSSCSTTVDNVACAAQNAANLDLKQDGTASNALTVHTPPTSGPYQISGAVEVIVSQPRPTLLWGTSMTVAARAVAAAPALNDYCIWVTAPSNPPGKKTSALYLQGKYDLEAPDCSIYVNSSSDNAVDITGKSGTINAHKLDVVGGLNGTPNRGSSVDIREHASPVTNPYGNLTGPSCTTGSDGNTVTTTSISGNYTPSGDVVCFQNQVTLKNGANLLGKAGDGVVYVFEQGVIIDTGATVTLGSAPQGVGKPTDGAVLDLAGGPLIQDSNSILNLYAPTAGPYNGIGILMPSTNKSTGDQSKGSACKGSSLPCLEVQFGSNNETIDGMIYAPGAEVYLQDNGGGVTASGVVAYHLYIQSSTLKITGYSVTNASTSPFKTVSLVE